MKRTNRLTEGNILHTLIRFAVPVFFTLFLQALYGMEFAGLEVHFTVDGAQLTVRDITLL